MRRSFLALLAGFFLWSVAIPVVAAPASGAVVGGSCTETDLNTALSTGGNITFNCGGPTTITLTTAKSIGQDTTLDGGGVITLTGNLNTRLFSVDSETNFTLKNIVLDRGYSNSSDGGAISNHGTLTIQNSTIQGSQTDVSHSGGAIFSDGPVFISGSQFHEDNAGSAGVLFANFGDAQVTIDNSTFSDNQAFNTTTGFGGALWVGTQAQLTLDHSLLQFNQATFGGALYISPGGVVTITGSPYAASFYSNSATHDGGAINNQATGRLTTSGVQLAHNRVPTATAAIGNGGGIYSAGPLALHDTFFQFNQARQGGALMVEPPASPETPVLLEHNSFIANSSQVSGGALYLSGAGAVVTITNTLLDENLATVGAGGAIARVNARLTIFDSSLIANVADQFGGGLWATTTGGSSGTGGAVQVLDTTINQNHLHTGDQGGGINDAGAQINLRNVTLAENDNGLYLAGGGVVLSTTNSVFWNPGFLNCDSAGAHPLSLGGNYSSDTSCTFSSANDEINVDHDPLGPRMIDTTDETFGTVYYLPLAGDSLINTALPVCSLRDERGATRPDACDKGAVEFGGLLPQMFFSLIGK